MLIRRKSDVFKLSGILLQTNIAQLWHPQRLNPMLQVRQLRRFILTIIIKHSDIGILPDIGPMGIRISRLGVPKLNVMRLVHVLAWVVPGHFYVDFRKSPQWRHSPALHIIKTLLILFCIFSPPSRPHESGVAKWVPVQTLRLHRLWRQIVPTCVKNV